MKRSVLLDTGPLVALLNQRDRHHAWARAAFADIEPPLHTCEAVIVEACHLMAKVRRGEQVVLEVLRRGGVEIPFRLDGEIARVQELRARYANVPMDLADACLVRMIELGMGETILTLDSDFAIYRSQGHHLIPVIRPD